MSILIEGNYWVGQKSLLGPLHLTENHEHTFGSTQYIVNRQIVTHMVSGINKVNLKGGTIREPKDGTTYCVQKRQERLTRIRAT